MNHQEFTEELARKGLNAPRVTPEQVEAQIAGEYYVNPEAITHNIPDLNRLTICILVMRNGFAVTGESACVDPLNFDAELGRRIAKDKAREKIWPLLGYMLREKLYREALEAFPNQQQKVPP